MFADALYVGDTSVDRVMLGDVEVWSSAPSLPVVHITGTSGNVSRDQFRQACIDYGTTYNTVTELPFLLDTSQATNLDNMFSGCSALSAAPELNLTNVTTMGWMFMSCTSLVRVPDLHVWHIRWLTGLFFQCSSLTDGNVRLIGKRSPIDASRMIEGSGLTRLPFYDTNGNPI